MANSRGRSGLLSDEDIARGLASVAWTRDGVAIVKTVTRQDFAEALAYVNRVGELAEARNHHPDIAISWNMVTLTLTTHSAGGLTQADLDLAAAIDALLS
ncbi:MAG TPA: 4a-hydroxytetrahydrobiopterin dehydratase [Acidimicrobiales bacterium]